MASPVKRKIEALVSSNSGLVVGSDKLSTEGQSLDPRAPGRSSFRRGSKRGRFWKHHKGLESFADITWDETREETNVEETINWMPIPPTFSLDVTAMKEWIVQGEKKLTPETETKYVPEEALNKMLTAKNVFNELGDRDLRNARTRANPFEMIKGAFFQNRAAMKMANLDAVFDFILSNPRDSSGELQVDPNGDELFYFADICAGPGGFTEYLLWKHAWNAHGFGITLKAKDDFNLKDFLASSPEMFEPHYGVGGLDGDGDMTRPRNIKAFAAAVRKATDGQGVHLVMGDGGFSVDGQEHLQEVLSRRLCLCQCLCALCILREGGNFVCKLFDIFTSFSIGLIFLLYRAFERVAIHKPNTSRPANAERYIVCRGFKSSLAGPIRDHLIAANRKFQKLAKDSNQDVHSIVPDDIVAQDHDFVQYITKSNERLALRQAMYLEKYKAYALNPYLYDTRQKLLRDLSLGFWQIPDIPRSDPSRPAPDLRLRQLFKDEQTWITAAGSTPFNPADIVNVFDHRVIVSGGRPFFLFSLGNQFVFQWVGDRWDLLSSHLLKIPKDTLLLAEVIQMHKVPCEGAPADSGSKQDMLQILDALILNGRTVGDLPFTERHRLCRKFCKAIRHSINPAVTPVVAPELLNLEDLRTSRDRFKLIKYRGGDRVAFYDEEKQSFLAAQGLNVFRIVTEPWIITWSRTHQRTYFFDRKDGTSSFTAPTESALSFSKTMESRMYWSWKNAKAIMATVEIEDYLRFDDVLDVIDAKRPPQQRIHPQSDNQAIAAEDPVDECVPQG